MNKRSILGKTTLVQQVARNPDADWRNGFRFLAFVIRRFVADGCSGRAAALTYTSLLALVPLLAISFAIFAAFPAFEDLRDELQTYIFENFVPEVGLTVYQHLMKFTAQTGQLTSVGIVFLIVTSVMLLTTISNSFDAVWRVREGRPLATRLLVYWAMLTLAPLLLGASLSMSSYLFTAARSSGIEDWTGPLGKFTPFVPLILQFIGFSVLLFVMPSHPIRWRDALIGGSTVALLFEILKKGFGYYVANFPTYETIYGALAAFPILLVWMYISWLVVLLGAELTAALPEWRAGLRDPTHSNAAKPWRRLMITLAILHGLLAASRRGGGLNQRRLARFVRVAPNALDENLETLRDALYIAKTERGEWLLARDLSAVTLGDLNRSLGLDPEVAGDVSPDDLAWKRRYGEIVDAIARSATEQLDVDLKTLLAADEDMEILGLSEEAEGTEPIAGRWGRLLAWLGLGWIGSS